MGDKKRLARAGLEVMDRLDLPGELAVGVGRMELVGDRQFYMEQHRGVLRYSTEVIDIAAADMTVRITGRELQLLAMTDRELRISGTIHALELLTQEGPRIVRSSIFYRGRRWCGSRADARSGCGTSETHGASPSGG